MQTLTIEPTYPFLVPETHSVTICLVGCGGTGSHIAQTLARLASHCRDTGGPRITLALLDGDVVEAKNVGRQLFSPADVGKNKAQVLAARFSAVFGLPIVAGATMLGDERVTHAGYGILVGAVDGAAGRRSLQHQLHLGGWRVWVDCGNHESSGQVVAGTVAHRDRLQGVLKLGVCSGLPVAPLIYPELLKDAPIVARQDCAAAVQDNAQSLMVNQTMAAIAGQYLYQLIVGRRLTTFRTVVDLHSLTIDRKSVV